MSRAEIHALQRAGSQARGATVYVTLEPCSHHDALRPRRCLGGGGRLRVVAAMQDPDPRVAGGGLQRLRARTQWSAVVWGQARELNIGFVARMTRARPWLRIKTAGSLDGRTALRNGQSQWITGAAARRDGHRWRARSCAVMIGVGTLLADNPRLTVRDVKTTRQPMRIVVDRQLEVPLDAHVLEGGHALIVTAQERPEKVRQLEQLGAQRVRLPNPEGKVVFPR